MKMKVLKFIALFVLVISVFFTAAAQTKRKSDFKIEAGYLYLYDNLNKNDYYKYIGYNDDNLNNTYGVDLKFSKSTSYDFVDIFIGTTFIYKPASYSLAFTPGYTSSMYHNMNGGGVYVGISPELKGRHFGLTVDMGVGVFSFKEYKSIVQNDRTPSIDVFDRRASSGLGAISSIGFYAKAGKLGVNPQLQMIYSGGGNTSFTFWGLNIPLTYSF